jgi:hypothetical protein
MGCGWGFRRGSLLRRWQPPKRKTYEAQPDSGGHKRASAAALVDAFTRQYEKDRDESRSREGHRIFREWLTIAGLFITAIVAFFQWRELNKTDHTLKDTARQQLRAYVYVEKASVIIDSRKLRAIVDLRNSGQTPAYDLTVVSRTDGNDFGKAFVPRPFENVPLDKTILGPSGAISPNSEMEILADNDLVLQAFKQGQGVIYVTGQARYRDAFNRQWVLDFRMRSHSFDGAKWILAPTEEGNIETELK